MKALLTLAVILATLPAAAFAATDKEFLEDAMKGDNTEVAMGKLAVSNGGSAQTRAYGKMLIHDHGAHRLKVAALERGMGMHPTMALSEDGMKSRQMMMAMHGTAFDSAFKQDMIDDHQKDIAKYEDEANSATSPKLRMLAQDTLPTLHKHLDGANAL